MGKTKQHKNKDAVEFVLVNRGMDDPNYNNPEAPGKILLHVPKDNIKQDHHDNIINQIPEINRGVYTEKAIQNNLKELGIKTLDSDFDPKELAKAFNDINKNHLSEKVKSELVNGNIKVTEEEIVDTSTSKKKVVLHNNDKIDNTDNIDKIIAGSKISAEITEYNKYGLRKDINPEILNYITDKEFQEGVDIFIPAPDGTPIDTNRFDIDIPLDKMDEEHKEVYQTLQEDVEAEELEDNFLLLANEGELPIAVDGKETNIIKEADEMIIVETIDRAKNPSYKYITKEEKEFLDRQAEIAKSIKTKTTEKVEYKGLTAKYEDEEEFEDYEFDEDEDCDELKEESINEEDEECSQGSQYSQNDEEKENSNNLIKEREEDKIEFCENNFKIEYIDKKETKKKKTNMRKSVKQEENFTTTDLENLIHDETFVKATIDLFENHVEEENPNDEGIPIYYPKKRLDITAVHGKVGYLPKTVTAPIIAKSQSSIITDKTDLKNSIVVNSSKPLLPLGEESKEEKKLRKKLFKEERKEKRKQKKELKQAFQVK
jgi:hypothetical protein